MSKQKINSFEKKFIQHGNQCGNEIAEVMKKKHPDMQIYSLYRSAVGIKYDEKTRCIRLILAGDPHVHGHNEIKPNYRESEFFIIGNRFSPVFVDTFGIWANFDPDYVELRSERAKKRRRVRKKCLN